MRKKITATVRQVHKDAFQESMGRVIHRMTENPFAEKVTQHFVRRELSFMKRREKISDCKITIDYTIGYIERAMASFNHNVKIDLEELRMTYRDLCYYLGVDYGDLFDILIELEKERKQEKKAA